MVSIFHLPKGQYYLLKSKAGLSETDIEKFRWLFNEAELLEESHDKRFFYWPQERNDHPMEYKCSRDRAKHGY